MHKMLLQLPTHLETARILLCPYQPGEGGWYYAMSKKNRSHLLRYEADNVVMSIQSEQEAEILVRELATEWAARNFEHLPAHRVRLRCDDANVRSYRVAERCGSVREGHLRENRKNPDGTFSGTLCYGLLKGEFEAGNR